jgi:hypothetical protein
MPGGRRKSRTPRVPDEIDRQLPTHDELLEKGIHVLRQVVVELEGLVGEVQRRDLAEVEVHAHAGAVICLGLVVVLHVAPQLVAQERLKEHAARVGPPVKKPDRAAVLSTFRASGALSRQFFDASGYATQG